MVVVVKVKVELVHRLVGHVTLCFEREGVVRARVGRGLAQVAPEASWAWDACTYAGGAEASVVRADGAWDARGDAGRAVTAATAQRGGARASGAIVAARTGARAQRAHLWGQGLRMKEVRVGRQSSDDSITSAVGCKGYESDRLSP